MLHEALSDHMLSGTNKLKGLKDLEDLPEHVRMLAPRLQWFWMLQSAIMVREDVRVHRADVCVHICYQFERIFINPVWFWMLQSPAWSGRMCVSTCVICFSCTRSTTSTRQSQGSSSPPLWRASVLLVLDNSASGGGSNTGEQPCQI